MSLSINGDDRRIMDRSLVRLVVWGILGSGIVQLAYLGHGDSGLAANLKMALLFSAAGGFVTVVWAVLSGSLASVAEARSTKH